MVNSLRHAGNPGLGSMYQDFMVTLRDCLSAQSPPAAIWTLSYVGHETASPPLLPTGALSTVFIDIVTVVILYYTFATSK